MPTPQRRVAHKIKAARLAHNRTITQAAARAGITRNTWAKAEAGNLGCVPTLEAIGQSLGWRAGTAMRILTAMYDDSPSPLRITTLSHATSGLADYAVVDAALELDADTIELIYEAVAAADHGPPDAIAWHAAADLPPGVYLVRHIDPPTQLVALDFASSTDMLAAAVNVHAQHVISGEGWEPK